jgi:gas vesicle protein
MDSGTFYGGIAIGIIIGFFIFLHIAKSLGNSGDSSNTRKMNDPIKIMGLSIQESLNSIEEVHQMSLLLTDTRERANRIPDLIKQKQHILTNHLCKLDLIEDPQYRVLRKNTIVYIQSIQDLLDTYLF